MSYTTGAWLYIMTNRPHGILYVGTTVNLPRRAWEHREGVVDGFTKRYGLKRLVYFERHACSPRDSASEPSSIGRAPGKYG